MRLEVRPFKYTVHDSDTGDVVGAVELWGSNLVAFSYDGDDFSRPTRLADPTDPARAAYFDTPEDAAEAILRHKTNVGT